MSQRDPVVPRALVRRQALTLDGAAPAVQEAHAGGPERLRLQRFPVQYIYTRVVVRRR